MIHVTQPVSTRRKKILPSTKQRILDRDGWLCVYCDDEGNQIDHIIPYSFGADDSDGNLVTACARCNGILHDQIFNSFEDKRHYLRKKLHLLWFF